MNAIRRATSLVFAGVSAIAAAGELSITEPTVMTHSGDYDNAVISAELTIASGAKVIAVGKSTKIDAVVTLREGAKFSTSSSSRQYSPVELGANGFISSSVSGWIRASRASAWTLSTRSARMLTCRFPTTVPSSMTISGNCPGKPSGKRVWCPLANAGARTRNGQSSTAHPTAAKCPWCSSLSTSAWIRLLGKNGTWLPCLCPN